MTTYPTLNNEPELLETKTRDDEFKNLKYQTEKHNYENMLKSLKIDNEYYNKKNTSFRNQNVILIITETLIGEGSFVSSSTLAK